MPLKVIGAGMGRTGTMSLKLALEQLGFGPCCHMSELLFKPENHWRWPLWERAFDDEPVDWEEVFRGFSASVDDPTNYYYRELSAAYPEAKVILTVRDPESWFRSIEATIGSPELRARITASPDGAPISAKSHAAQIKRGFRSPQMPENPAERQKARIADFNRWTQEVKRSLPPKRLLVFEVKEGWAPLCAFLNVPVPDTPFPRENSTEDFQRRFLMQS